MDRLAITSVTDVVLAALAYFLAGMLAGRPKARWSALWFWSGALLALATSALGAGIDHGFVEPAGHDRFLLQRTDWLLMGLVAFCALMATARQFLAPRWHRPMLAIGVLQLLVYGVAVVLVGDFVVVAVNYVPVMLLLLVLSIRGLRDGTGTWWMISGVVVMLVASAVQVGKVDVLKPLDHDGLYHVIAMAGVILLYEGGRRLRTT
jgi:hypothetical protein